MSSINNIQAISFPANEVKIQSPYLYLQCAGSTGADGSTFGAHLRWAFLRNLDTHIAKGDYATTRVNFNRPDDFVSVLRSRYERRFPTRVSFLVVPNVVNDARAFWIYIDADTNTTVYIHFRDAAKYAAVRANHDPSARTIDFMEAYCPALIEVELKEKLCFAVEFDVKHNSETVMRAEALSVETNIPLSPQFVSCRKRFDVNNWCDHVEAVRTESVKGVETDRRTEPQMADSIDDGHNLLPNGSFENPPSEFGFETDYQLQGKSLPGVMNLTSDAHVLNSSWVGVPHTGQQFLAVDGSTVSGKAVIRFTLDVEPVTPYRFSGWLATLWPQDVSIPLMFRFTPGEGAEESFFQTTPGTTNVWEEFNIQWKSFHSRTLTVEIVALSTLSVGNDFGIDDLKISVNSKEEVECRPRVKSENIRSVRFDVERGYPITLEFETYDKYIAGAVWESLDRFALTIEDDNAFRRLEPEPNTVNGHWKKFNDNALVNIENYRERWTQPGGLRYGVENYIALSNTDPQALKTLPGDGPDDGSIQISVRDALSMVSLDYHVARMLGLGFLDRTIAIETHEYIYLCTYETEGALDDTNVSRLVSHFYMGVPTRPTDNRLPDPPTLLPVTYGLAIDNGEVQPTHLTDLEGYTSDGQSRYVNLFVEQDEDDNSPLGPFFEPDLQFCAIEKTSSVFYGIEYRELGEATWRKQEIAHDRDYSDLDSPPSFETLPLPNNATPAIAVPILRHEEKEAGFHEYGSYGINLLSRASEVGNIVATNETDIKKANLLLPPSNFAVQLIQKEEPLMLTTPIEQAMLRDLTGPDKTLVRVTFDYSHVQDLSYGFADKVELFFRKETPRNVVGAIKSIADDPADNHRCVIRTSSYNVNSQGTTIDPEIDSQLFDNFIGGVFSCQLENYIVTGISSSNVAGEGPIFTTQKNVLSNASNPGAKKSFFTVREYKGPKLDSASNAQVMFMAVENMAESASWGTQTNPPPTITIGDGTWRTNPETYTQDDDTITINLRGIRAFASVNHEEQADIGFYRIEFQIYKLPHHPQYQETNPVDWYKGVVRIAREDSPNGPKKVLDVLIIENVGNNELLKLHVVDNTYSVDDNIVIGANVEVTFYPGYRLYLHANSLHDFTAAMIQPAAGEGSRKTWLGARAIESSLAYNSSIGMPAPIIAFETVEPLVPKEPSGPEFATRPDFYYKSSYTFRLDFFEGHKPYSVVMYRGNDEAILRTLYRDERYKEVVQQLEQLGENDLYRADRWRNLLSFNYVYDIEGYPYYDPSGSSVNGEFRKFPAGTGYGFPSPDNEDFDGGNQPFGEKVKTVLLPTFTPLTEFPLIYDSINGPSYVPVPKPQTIRSADGKLLDPSDPAFDIAPMAKKTGNGFEIQFTDFTLDGTSKNIFFYFSCEIGNGGQLGEPSPIAGPVLLINTRPPEAPAIKRMYVVEPNDFENTGPVVKFEINPYPEVQKVGRVLIYRASDPANSLSVRTMQVVKTIDFVETNQIGAPITFLSDDFEDGFVPYGDPLFYRLVALRKVKYPDIGTDWAPSQPSKLLLTAVPDFNNPEAAEITVTSDGISGSPPVITNVVLSWTAAVYNGTYYLDKMNATGNWVTIYRIKTNQNVTIDLAETDLGTNVLPKKNDDGDAPIYHRFRVRTENSSGLFNLAQKVLTL